MSDTRWEMDSGGLSLILMIDGVNTAGLDLQLRHEPTDMAVQLQRMRELACRFNNFEALLAACEAAKEVVQMVIRWDKQNQDSVLQQIDAAIAAARGE